jgi:hypothetical protein
MAQLKDFQTGAVGDSFNGPIGTTTAAAGAFTTLTASSTLNVTGVATLGNGAILGTPASGTVTNLTGTASININGTVGATTPTTGAFTTLSASSTVSGTGFSTYLASPPAIGGTAAAAGAFTTLAASGAVTLSGGTANGVAYLNGSKVVTSGSALVFDGTNLGVGTSSPAAKLHVQATQASMNMISTGTGNPYIDFYTGTSSLVGNIYGVNGGGVAIGTNGGTEGMRLTSTGLGIGTSSPSRKLQVIGTAAVSSDFYGGYANTAANIIASSSVANGGAGFSQFLFGNTSSDSRGYLSYTHASDSILFGTTGTTKATLDSSGNLGLGVTPSAWDTTFTGVFEQAYGANIAATSNQVNYGLNYRYNGGWLYKNSAPATRYNQSNGIHAWYNAPSGTAGNAITFTQAMTLLANGSLLIGYTADQSSGKLQVNGAGRIGNFDFNTDDITYGGGGNFQVGTVFGVPMLFKTSNTERARIDSSGNLLVGQTSDTATSLSGIGVTGNNRTITAYTSAGASAGTLLHARRDSDGNAVQFVYGSWSSFVGSISVTSSATAYNTSSDYRLKNTIAPMTGALAKVALLKPVTYKWNADGSDGEGFIAHELAEVVPQCVTGEKDAVDEDGNPKYQGIDTSFLVATLTAALQEAHGLIKSLETRISALEAK